MKTVIDAVNWFSGEWPDDANELVTTSEGWGGASRLIGSIEVRNTCFHSGVQNIGSDSWSILCNETEFNECLEWCENWQPTLTSDYFNNMSYKKYVAWYSTVKQVERSLGEEINKPELVYDKDGYGYELNALYEFSDYEDFEEFLSSNLISVNSSSSLQFITDDCSYLFCREVKSKLGTITPTKVKLVDGQAYRLMTDYRK